MSREQVMYCELPSSWLWTTVGELTSSMKNGIYKPKRFYSNNGTACLRMYNIESGRIVWKDVKRMNLTDEEIEQYALKPGDILVNRVNSRELVGKSASVPTGLEQCVYESKNIRLRLMPSLVDCRLVTHWMQIAAQPYFNSNAQQTVGMASINQQQLSALPLPLPPLPEQHRIVSKIEELFTRLDAGVEALEKVKALLNRYRQSVLKAAFEGKLTQAWREEQLKDPDSPLRREPASVLLERIRAEREKQSKGKRKKKQPEPIDTSELPELPEGWEWTGIGGVFNVCVGATPSRKRANYWNGEISWVSSGEVKFCRIRTTREKITAEGLAHCSTELHPPGTVLLGMIGEGRTRGQAAILDIPACNNQNSAAIRVSEAGLSPEYIYYFLELHYERTRRIGSGNNQPALNKSRVQSIVFPLAPLVEQQQVVAEVERLLSVTDATAQAINQSLQHSNRLRQSILKRAFEGKLVPQDPNDEPAEKLLERIKAEKAKADSKGNHKAKRRRSRS